MNYKNGVLSATIGILQQLLTLAFGLIVPRLFIRTFGSEMNGFLSSIGNIYSYLALVEAGVGTAAIQALWGPLGRDDKRSVNEIMSATAQWYNRAGFIYLLGVIAISIFYPLTVKTTIPFWTIFIITILSGAGDVINFWVQGKYKVLLQAEGKKYIMSLVTMVVYVASNIIKIVLLLKGFDVIAIHIGYFIISLCTMVFYWIYMRRNYKWLNLKATPNKAALSQSSAVFVQQIAGMITSNTDILVLTYVAQDLKSVSVYNVYLMIYATVGKLFSTFFGSFHYLLGQTYNNDQEHYMQMHRKYEAISMAGAFALYTIAYLLTTPFMKVYTAGITDIKYVDFYLPILFTGMHLLSSGREACARVITFAGHFKQMQPSSIAEAVINIVISCILVRKIGIYGVLIGTIVAFLPIVFYVIYYANKNILHRSQWHTYKLWISNSVVLALSCLVFRFFNLTATSIPAFFLKAIPCGLVVCLLYFAELWIFNRDAAKFTLNSIKKALSKLILKKTKHN